MCGTSAVLPAVNVTDRPESQYTGEQRASVPSFYISRRAEPAGIINMIGVIAYGGTWGRQGMRATLGREG